MRDDLNDTPTLDERQENSSTPEQKKTLDLAPIHTEGQQNYDEQSITDFLDIVFHALDLDGDAEVLTWFSKTNRPGYPVSESDLKQKMRRITSPRTLYYSVASGLPNEEKRLYNRKTAFNAMHVLVLDDLGTKVPLDKIPENMPPTYIIESSPGNYQYGYVLETPINDVHLAQALVQLVYEAGFSDKGGALANKIVRLPGGINGKPGENQLFHVKLQDMDPDRLWTPEKLLDLMNIGVSWDDLQNDPELVKRRRKSKMGTNAWTPAKTEHASPDGVGDVLLEWLYDEKMVIQDGDPEWITIRCPWAHEHTSPGEDAGYSPLGRGGGAFAERRGFNCFHEHCSGRHAGDLIQWAGANGGPVDVPVRDPVAAAVARYVVDAPSMLYWDISMTNPIPIPQNGFKMVLPGSVRVTDADGREKSVSKVALFNEHPFRVLAYGQTYDPTTEAKLVKGKENEYLINRFAQPEWGDGLYDQTHIDQFLDFITYLVPNHMEREYFLDWLAAKAQNMGFRGAAILMTTQAQGTGRTTLASMLQQLFGRHNCETVPFDKLTGGGEFNEFMTRPMIFSNETLATATGENMFKVYERMKELIDPRPIEVRINPKYGRQSTQTVYSSYMLFSNHDNAVYASAQDRRIFVIKNPSKPAEQHYFTELNNWIDTLSKDGEPVWCKHVWRWLRVRPVNVEEMLKPAPATEAKDEMLIYSRGAVGHCIDELMKVWPVAAVTASAVKKVLAPFYVRFDYDNPKTRDRVLLRALNDTTVTAFDGKKYRVAGAVTRVRLLPRANVNAHDEKAIAQAAEALRDMLEDEKALAALAEVVEHALADIET